MLRIAAEGKLQVARLKHQAIVVYAHNICVVASSKDVSVTEFSRGGLWCPLLATCVTGYNTVVQDHFRIGTSWYRISLRHI